MFPNSEPLSEPLEVVPMTSYVIHKHEDNGPKVNLKVEKNTKGYNWEATITNAKSVEEAIAMVREAESKLKLQFGAEPEKEG